jgi:hypothetical protein
MKCSYLYRMQRPGILPTLVDRGYCHSQKGLKSLAYFLDCMEQHEYNSELRHVNILLFLFKRCLYKL